MENLRTRTKGKAAPLGSPGTVLKIARLVPETTGQVERGMLS